MSAVKVTKNEKKKDRTLVFHYDFLLIFRILREYICLREYGLCGKSYELRAHFD